MLFLVVILGCGKVERELIVTTEPSEASVMIDGQKLSKVTPVTWTFTHYGTHEIVIEKKGFKRVREMVKIRSPFYQWFPIDFITEILLPLHLKDVHRVSYELAPAERSSKEEVLKRAEKFRQEVRPRVGLQKQ